MPITTEIGEDPAQFRDLAAAWLRTEPVGNNVAVTVLGSALDAGAPTSAVAPGQEFRWALARDDAALVGAAVCTPPRPVALSVMPPGAAAAIADRLAADAFPAPGVSGPAAAVEEYAARWRHATGAIASQRVEMRIYATAAVTAPAGIPGRLRVADPADRELLIEWTGAFLDEVHLQVPNADPAPPVDSRLAAGRLLLWEVAGRPVAMAGTSPPVAGISRVGVVYTPPEHRRRGYAAAVTAGVTARELAAGAAGCMLFAETSNATSNGVYRRIGYREVGGAVEITFGQPDG